MMLTMINYHNSDVDRQTSFRYLRIRVNHFRIHRKIPPDPAKNPEVIASALCYAMLCYAMLCYAAMLP
jgi:hypothetical protein